MKVKIFHRQTEALKNAIIKEAKPNELPSIQDGWRFNFPRNLSKLLNAKAYVLVLEEDQSKPLGCLIFQMIEGIRPYIAYLESSPRNVGSEKEFESIAGCLIAFSFRLSLMLGQGDFQGYLELDVFEKKSENELKLMSNYSAKYGFQRISNTRMCLFDDHGHQLINDYLIL